MHKFKVLQRPLRVQKDARRCSSIARLTVSTLTPKLLLSKPARDLSPDAVKTAQSDSLRPREQVFAATRPSSSSVTPMESVEGSPVSRERDLGTDIIEVTRNFRSA